MYKKKIERQKRIFSIKTATGQKKIEIAMSKSDANLFF